MRLGVQPDGSAIDVTEHRKLVLWTIRRYGFSRAAQGTIEYEDLIQEGMIGLLRAAETYSPDLGSWSTFATWWVRHAVGRFLENRARTIRIPCYLQARRRAAGQRVHPHVRSLDAPIVGHDGDEMSRHEVMSADGASPEDEADDRERAALLETLIRRARLTPRERRVLELRARDVTLDAIGVELGVSRERVRQVERDGLLRLRRAAGVRTDAQLSLAEPKNRKPTHRLETKAPCHMQQANQPEFLSSP